MLVEERIINGGPQKIYRFDNGYGASVIESHMSYGTELAVLHFNSEDNYDFTLVYDTPITDDVLGHLTEEELEETLEKISLLENTNEV